MRQIAYRVVLITSLTMGGCSYKAHNYLGAWRDENNIPHYVFKSGAVHLLAEPSPSPPWRYGTLVPYTIKRDDVAPDEITAAHGPMRFEREQLRPDPSAYRFVHLTDIQVRDRCVGLGPFLRGLAKLKTDAVEGSYYGDHADVFYLAYVLDAIRRGVEAGYFDVVVHGGDAVQLGVRSEFRAFDYFMETFLLGPSSGSDCWLHGTIDVDAARPGEPPMYLNMIGNHDRFFMGCFTRRFLAIRWTETDTPVESLDGWIEQLDKLVRNYSNEPNGLGIEPNDLRQNLGGYYSFDRTWPDVGKIRMIVLNTSGATILNRVSEEAALYPSIGLAQFEWLGRTLADAEERAAIKAVVVFGHNQLAEILVNRYPAPPGEKTPFTRLRRNRAARDDSFLDVATLLGAHRKVVSYICGHQHCGSPRVDWSDDVPSIRETFAKANERLRRKRARFERGRRKKTTVEGFFDPPPTEKSIRYPFCEITTPSVQEYPKCFAVMSLFLHPGEGGEGDRVSLGTQYYNLNDLLPPTGAALFDKETPLSVGADERRALLNWRNRLNSLTDGRSDARRYRMHLLAEYALAGEYRDLQIRPADIGVVYNERIRPEILAVYHRIEAFMQLMKNLQATGVPEPDAWQAVRAQLEAPRYRDKVSRAPGEPEPPGSK